MVLRWTVKTLHRYLVKKFADSTFITVFPVIFFLNCLLLEPLRLKTSYYNINSLEYVLTKEIFLHSFDRFSFW